MSPFTKKPESASSQRKRFRFFLFFLLVALLILSFSIENGSIQPLFSTGAIALGLLILRNLTL
jgi:hypothetical protein